MTSNTGFDSLVFKGALMVHTSLFVAVNGYSLGYRGAAHPWYAAKDVCFKLA